MNGFLNINKPADWTSHDVVARIRRLLKIDKVGHTGTLDPAATGVLPVCLGKATKVAQFLLMTDKVYRVVMRLGENTDTQDATGVVLVRRPAGSLSTDAVREAVESFRGEITQVVPMYSAVKVGGQPLYKAARRNEQVDRPSRKVSIHGIRILDIAGEPGGPVLDVTFDTTVSKGTYIRTLCEDIGEQLGVGGHLLRLERRASGPFHIDRSLGMDEVGDRAAAGTLEDSLVPIGEALSSYSRVQVTLKASLRVIHGGKIGAHEIKDGPGRFRTGETLLVFNPTNELIALASALTGSESLSDSARAGSLFKVDKVLV